MLNIGLDGGLSVLGLGVVAWLASKIVDRILDWAFGKKIIERCIKEVRWRVRAFKTRGDPLKITYEIKYSPTSNYSVRETKKIVSEGLKTAGEHSKGRAEIDTLAWDEQRGENGFVEIDYIECDYPFQMEVSLIEDLDNLRETFSQLGGKNSRINPL
ncbi:hypothetical protein HYG81_00700 [Natrinema zhouii]|uniref:Uncharacterized protein n=1 Tax=Natrinema zhouii TaxID=1710539 RepID=A0A7D6CP52_9EURY|nr:hypothetical protein [Natrinema zhouii]QLK26178.1 hypothetical protein HYG81_00700 [Natrinema zhouii]